MCCVLYVILGIFILAQKAGKFQEWETEKNRKQVKQIVLILFVTNTIACSLFFIDNAENKMGSDAGRKIYRNTYGGGEKEEEYEVSVGKDVKGEKISVNVEEQQYTTSEIQKIFKKIIKELDTVILGENQSADHVEKNLNLPTKWKEYPVRIEWELDNYEVLDTHGVIQTEKTKKDGTLVELRGTLVYGEEEALYVTNVRVYPATKTKAGKILDAVQEKLLAAEEKTREKEMFLLPEKVDGQVIHWKKKTDKRGYFILLLGVIAAIFSVLLEKENAKNEKKKKQEQMLTDYPEIISKFTLLLSTGMTVKNVWKKIVSNYEEQKVVLGTRPAYEEMGYSCYEMQGGIPETEAYEHFGKRCELTVYVKFGALLSQNMKKGTKGLVELLQMESVQAFENRKSRAKRLGEEAGTKLLLPMFAMLAVVLVIVVVPAFLSMQL